MKQFFKMSEMLAGYHQDVKTRFPSKVNNDMKTVIEDFEEDFEEDSDVYCPLCNSCGCEGCCSPLKCIDYHLNPMKGKYCEYNLYDVHYNYHLADALMNYLVDKFANTDIMADIDNICNSVSDKCDEYFNSEE